MLEFQFHSTYADIEIDNPDLFLTFFHLAEMRHRQIATDTRLLVSARYVMQEADNQHPAYSICKSALDRGIDYLTIEYIGEIDISNTLILFGAIR